MPASEERSISEFPSALNILATTLLLASTYDSGNDSYDSEKITAVDLASAILGDFEYTQDLATNVKTIFGAINSIMVLSGTTVPSSAIGSNGQLYFKYTSSGGTDTVDGLYWKINNAWVEVSTGGGGGGASVTLGTTVPSDATGSNGDLYVQYDSVTYSVIEYFVKINGSWRKSPYSRVVALTQAEYDLITPDTSTLYIITDAQSNYQTKTDNSLDTTDKTVVGAINELKTGLSNTNDKIGYLRSSFYLGNYTSFNITLPDIRQGGDNFNHMTMIIGNNAFAILCCSYSQSALSVVSLGSNTITATKSANSFNITINLQDTSWGGIRVITLD